MRKGSIKLQNLSGGEVTSSPLLETPPKYSRLLRNFYINSKGHIAKVPGYSAVSQEIADCELSTGIDFNKSDGTSIILAGGKYNTPSTAPYEETDGTITAREITFTGTGTNDVTTNAAYTGAGTAVYTVEVAQGYPSPQYDIWRWKKDSGAWNNFGGVYPLPASIDLGDGVLIYIATSSDHTTGDKWVFTARASHLDDLSVSGSYSGAAAATFDVEIDSEGTPDTFRWRKDAGAWTSGVAITGAAQLLSDGVSITFAATTGHSYTFYWTITGPIVATTGAVYRLESGNLSRIKSDFASSNPIYMSQMGDIVVMSNYSDRPIAYDGSTFQNINLPFGNSVEFVGTGLNDFTANVSFTYDTATYEVIVDAVGTPTIAPTFSGVGIDDMAVPDPNFSGDAQSANFDIIITKAGTGDTFKYNLNGGLFIEDNALSNLTPGTIMAGSLRLKAAQLYGHNSEDFYEVLVSSGGTPNRYQWRKNGGAWSEEADCSTTYTLLDSGYSIAFVNTGGNTVGTVYGWQIDGATDPDEFQWRKDGGSWSSSIDIVPGAIDIGEGLSVQFDYMTGHTVNDTWDFDAERDTVKFRETSGAYTTGQLITGEYQDIVAGVQFKFSAINGHTLGDKWTIPLTQNVRIGKTYPYRNRLWAIGADRLTAYFSELVQPTNFTGTGAGYIDFRFVLPEGDELMDICGVLNYLAFFFKNHIVVYAGTDPTAQGDFIVYQNIGNLGIVAPETVVPVGADVFFLTDKGVKNLKQVLNAGAVNVDNVSAPIDQDIVDAIKANTSGVYDSAHYAKYGLVMFLIGTTIFVFNYRNNAWSRIVIPTVDDGAKILGMFNDSVGDIYMGGYDYLFKFDPAVATYNFNGQAPTYIWKTGMLPATSADSLYFTEMVLRLASFKAATLTVKARAVGFDTGYEDQSAFNEQTITVNAATPSDVVMNFVRAPLWGAGKYIQLEITESPTNVANDDLEITGLEIQGEVGSV